jgi:hypothetical protein
MRETAGEVISSRNFLQRALVLCSRKANTLKVEGPHLGGSRQSVGSAPNGIATRIEVIAICLKTGW